jgi:signal transduction histidine kinase
VHSLLQRQIRQRLADVDVTTGPWPAFLAAVDQSYREADADRNFVESAMEVSSAELLQANAELRGLVQVFPDLILHVDANGRVTARRGRSVRAFNPTKGALVGQPLRAFFCEVEAPAFDAALVSARDTGTVETVLRTCRDGAAVVVHEIRLAALGEGAGFIAIVRDVTDARRAEELRLAKEGAEAASRAKSAFLANMSHELRTPLNAILGYSEMLAEDAPPNFTDDLWKIHRSGRHLLQLLNAMLDIARIEAGMVKVELDAVDVEPLVADTLAAVRAQASAKGVAVSSTVEPTVESLVTDRVKLLQMLVALVGNAVKFTEQGSVLVAVARVAADGDAGLLFSVRDTGIGIETDHLARLFQDFAQVDESATRRFGGAGLGLALVRRLSGLIGGRVSVRSTPGVGSTFEVWLPLRPAADALPPVVPGHLVDAGGRS